MPPDFPSPPSSPPPALNPVTGALLQRENGNLAPNLDHPRVLCALRGLACELPNPGDLDYNGDDPSPAGGTGILPPTSPIPASHAPYALSSGWNGNHAANLSHPDVACVLRGHACEFPNPGELDCNGDGDDHAALLRVKAHLDGPFH